MAFSIAQIMVTVVAVVTTTTQLITTSWKSLHIGYIIAYQHRLLFCPEVAEQVVEFLSHSNMCICHYTLISAIQDKDSYNTPWEHEVMHMSINFSIYCHGS